MIIFFSFKTLPQRKARLSQQTAYLVIHDKTSLWMTNEAGFTPLHPARVKLNCVRWGQNAHFTLLIWAVVPLKGESGECWVKCCLHSQGNLLIWPSCWLSRPAENVPLSQSHFQKSEVSRQEPFWNHVLLKLPCQPSWTLPVLMHC